MLVSHHDAVTVKIGGAPAISSSTGIRTCHCQRIHGYYYTTDEETTLMARLNRWLEYFPARRQSIHSAAR